MRKKKISGIYRIDGPNGKVYIGSSVDIDKRWYEHKNGYRSNVHLQRSIKKYGLDAFKFSVIEIVDRIEDLERIEQIYLDILFTSLDESEIYNTARFVDAPQRGIKRTEETRRKLSESHKGKTFSEEHRRKLSEANKGKGKGKTFSEEHRRKLSEAKKGKGIGKGKTLSEEHRRKIGEANKDKTHSEETRRKMSEAKAKTYDVTLIAPDDTEYVNITGLRAFCKQHSLNAGVMSRLITGTHKQHKGWRLKQE